MMIPWLPLDSIASAYETLGLLFMTLASLTTWFVWGRPA
jgi:hypothetical protein